MGVEDEIKPINHIKRVKIQSKQPMNFIRATKDREKVFLTHLPDQVGILKNKIIDPTKYESAEIKDMRIDEKRSFELENCKLKSNHLKEEEKKNPEMKIKLNRNILKTTNKYAEEGELVDQVDTFEISNSQLF